MTRPKVFSLRRMHRTVALWSVFFLFVTTLTGLLWAYAPYLYWEKGYKARKQTFSFLSLAEARFSVSDILERMESSSSAEGNPKGNPEAVSEREVLSVKLYSDAGMLLYRVAYRDQKGKKERVALLDALSGNLLSPLPEETAIRFARQYVLGDPPVESATLLYDWVSRKAKKGREAWQVRFSDQGETEIFIDPETGVILEDQNRVRRFHFWVMRLHQFNFFGTHKILTLVSGLPLLVLIVTGLKMARRSKTKRTS